jgi:hypothetical protein
MTKKTIAFLILAFVSSTTLFAQTQNDLIGDWTVINLGLSENLAPDMKTKLADMTEKFQKASFHFKSNGEFTFDIPEKNLQIKSAKWNFEKTKKRVSISGKDPKGHVGNLMNFDVRIVQSTYYFLIEETPFTLEVKKVVLNSI